MGFTALYPGTFDPITNGHLDVIERAAAHADRLIVAVLENPAKVPLFSVEERLDMLKASAGHIPGVEFDSFSGLLVDYSARREVRAIVKGLRAVSDFDYELQMAQMNHRLGGVETFFISTNPRWSFLSSSLIKETAAFGGNVEGLVPDVVVERLAEKVSG